MATAPPASRAPADEAPAGARRSLTTRAVIWIGLAAGTAVTVLSVMHGIRFPGLEVVLSVLVTWALLVVLAATATELLRRHHRAMARHAWRHGKRGVSAAGRGTRRGGGWLARTTRAVIGHLTEKARARWENRQNIGGPTAPQAPPETTAPSAPGGAGGAPPSPAYSYGRADLRAAWPMSSAEEAHRRARAASADSGHTYVVTAYPPGGGPGTTVAAYTNGNAVHPATSGGTTPMPAQRPASRISPDRRARRTAASSGGTVPDAWGPVVAQAADFEPESDAHLLAWMTGQVTGMAAYAEALIEAYETGINTVGIDPKGLTALHDVADAAAHAAETMAGAKTQFADHYELPREFAAGGGLMTHDGRWVTGDGD